MDKQKKQNVKWFLGGVGIATAAMLIHRQYELTVIGMGIEKVLMTPELLAKFQAKYAAQITNIKI